MGTSTDTLLDETVTLGSAATDLDVTGLDGDVDGDYDINGTLFLDAAFIIATLQPEGSTSDQDGNFLGRTTGMTPGIVFSGDSTTLDLGGTDDNLGATLKFHGRLWSKTGRERLWTCESRMTQNAGNYSQWVTATWADTSTPITFLRFHSDVADGLLTGSLVRVRKLGNRG